MFIENIKVYDPKAELSPEDMEKIQIYLQGAVYCWCKNCRTENDEPEWFAVRTLFGGENYYWSGTPLQKLYEWHEENGAKDAKKNAGIDVGHLLKKTLSKDKRYFYAKKQPAGEYSIWEYKWNGEDDE